MKRKTKIVADVARRARYASREIGIAVLLSLAAIMFWLATKTVETHSSGGIANHSAAGPANGTN